MNYKEYIGTIKELNIRESIFFFFFIQYVFQLRLKFVVQAYWLIYYYICPKYSTGFI